VDVAVLILGESLSSLLGRMTNELLVQYEFQADEPANKYTEGEIQA